MYIGLGGVGGGFLPDLKLSIKRLKMTRLRFTLLNKLVDDLKIGFRSCFYSAFQDLVNTRSILPPAIGDYFHSEFCIMLNNIYISSWNFYFSISHITLAVWRLLAHSSHSFIRMSSSIYIGKITSSLLWMIITWTSRILSCGWNQSVNWIWGAKFINCILEFRKSKHVSAWLLISSLHLHA